MQPRTLGSLTFSLLLCSTILVAQTIPQGSSTPGPQTPRTPGLAGTPARDPNGNPNTEAPKGTGVIRGRVSAADSGKPVRRAQVRLGGINVRMAQVASTDGEGRYEFSTLPAGRYNLSVMKSGYVTLEFGQQRPFEPGKPLQLADAEVAEKIDFALPRGAVIAGRITDEVGEPIAGVQVMAMRYQYMPDGQRRLSPANTGPNFSGGTDDLGQFRVYGLTPGSYFLSATLRDFGMMFGGPTTTVVNSPTDPNNGYVTTYYPGTPNPDEAQALAVTIGQEASAYFSLVPARMSRVSGIVRMSDGRAASGYTISLRTVTAGLTTGIGGTQVGADGTFRLSNLPPGEHFLDIRPMFGPAGGITTGTPGSPPPPPEFASVPLSLSGQDIDGLVITTTTGATISGRVIFEATRAASGPTGGPTPMRVIAAQADPGPGAYFGMNTMDNGVIDEAGRFQIRGAGGRVVFRWSGPPGWFLKSVRMNGTDITDVPFDVRASTPSADLEVVVTDQQTTVSGNVKDSRGQPVNDYVVAILPDGLKEGISASRFTRTVRPDQNGHYNTTALPPGDYVAFAVETLDQGGLYDPAYQHEMKPHAKGFKLEDGQTLTLDLQLVQ
jgi:protocatechuate 3,4-dioxygenase beta subunit